MDASTLVVTLQAAVPGAEFEPVDSVDLHATFFAPAARLVEVMRTLREHSEFGFDLLADITATDLSPTEPRFEVIYTLVSTAKRQRARLKVRLHGNDAHLATISGIWAAANWLEREVWDMFGIAFDGHPDPRRILMPEDWEGFPLRKDYPVQIRMRPRTSEPLQVTEEEFKASIEHDRLTRHE